jgi:hypothetical protein
MPWWMKSGGSNRLERHKLQSQQRTFGLGRILQRRWLLEDWHTALGWRGSDAGGFIERCDRWFIRVSQSPFVPGRRGQLRGERRPEASPTGRVARSQRGGEWAY